MYPNGIENLWNFFSGSCLPTLTHNIGQLKIPMISYVKLAKGLVAIGIHAYTIASEFLALPNIEDLPSLDVEEGRDSILSDSNDSMKTELFDTISEPFYGDDLPLESPLVTESMKSTLKKKRGKKMKKPQKSYLTDAKVSYVKKKEDSKGPSPTYVCDQCSKSFKSKADLSSHVEFHASGELKFSCQVCHKKFETFGALGKHKRYHEKEFCELCGKNVTGNYTMHKRQAIYSFLLCLQKRILHEKCLEPARQTCRVLQMSGFGIRGCLPVEPSQRESTHGWEKLRLQGVFGEIYPNFESQRSHEGSREEFQEFVHVWQMSESLRD